jgi:hypothetical protein
MDVIERGSCGDFARIPLTARNCRKRTDVPASRCLSKGLQAIAAPLTGRRRACEPYRFVDVIEGAISLVMESNMRWMTQSKTDADSDAGVLSRRDVLAGIGMAGAVVVVGSTLLASGRAGANGIDSAIAQPDPKGKAETLKSDATRTRVSQRDGAAFDDSSEFSAQWRWRRRWRPWRRRRRWIVRCRRFWRRGRLVRVCRRVWW